MAALEAKYPRFPIRRGGGFCVGPDGIAVAEEFADAFAAAVPAEHWPLIEGDMEQTEHGFMVRLWVMSCDEADSIPDSVRDAVSDVCGAFNDKYMA
jgi:hypothetical protein